MAGTEAEPSGSPPVSGPGKSRKMKAMEEGAEGESTSGRMRQEIEKSVTSDTHDGGGEGALPLFLLGAPRRGHL